MGCGCAAVVNVAHEAVLRLVEGKPLQLRGGEPGLRPEGEEGAAARVHPREALGWLALEGGGGCSPFVVRMRRIHLLAVRVDVGTAGFHEPSLLSPGRRKPLGDSGGAVSAHACVQGWVRKSTAGSMCAGAPAKTLVLVWVPWKRRPAFARRGVAAGQRWRPAYRIVDHSIARRTPAKWRSCTENCGKWPTQRRSYHSIRVEGMAAAELRGWRSASWSCFPLAARRESSTSERRDAQNLVCAQRIAL